MNQVETILRTATRQGNTLNILTASAHEAYETALCKTGHRFWAYRAEGLKNWNPKFRPLPRNYVPLDHSKGPNQVPQDVQFDLALAHHRFGQQQS